MTPTPLTRRERRWLLAILAVTLALRVAVWTYHPVDPDEGAHLMDGRLALQGLIPFVDFSARRVLFTYVLAGLIRLVGPDYTLVRLSIVGLSLLTAALIFAIGRRLFDTRAALLAAGTFAVFPLAVIATPVVQMQPFSILAACGAAYCLVRSLESSRPAWLVATGALCAAGVQLRDSIIAVSAGFLLGLSLANWRRPGWLAGQWMLFGGGSWASSWRSPSGGARRQHRRRGGDRRSTHSTNSCGSPPLSPRSLPR
jgi:4-amino-4-deoxy-L-arabinose transferase-like glycosyltransferase